MSNLKKPACASKQDMLKLPTPYIYSFPQNVASEQKLGSEFAQLKIKYFEDSTPPATYPTFTATSLLIQLIFSHYIHTTQLGGKSEFFLSQKMLDKGLKVTMKK